MTHDRSWVGLEALSRDRPNEAATVIGKLLDEDADSTGECPRCLGRIMADMATRMGCVHAAAIAETMAHPPDEDAHDESEWN